MVVTCPLCGYRFDPYDSHTCGGCPLAHNCNKICCPNCQYGWVESSSIVSKLLGMLGKGTKVGRP